jgi:predicted RNA-binding protein
MENTPKYVCLQCDYNTCKKSNWGEHILTEKHKRLDLLDIYKSNSTYSYNCSLCDVKCSHLSIFNRHIKTKSHIKKLEIQQKNQPSKDTVVENTSALMKDNQELRNFIIEQTKLYADNMNVMLEKNSDILSKAIECCKPTNTTIVNNNQKSFNINVFLNDQCKDAINFSDFVKNIEITHQDLENNAQLGFVSGISKIFLDNLKQLGVNERPFHCTDTKRETMYIKDEDKWTKEADDSKLQKAIQTVSYRSIGKLQEWKQENPEYQDVNSEFSEKCLDMQRNTIAGRNREVYYPKVIHVLAKETMVDK